MRGKMREEYRDAEEIIRKSIADILPDNAVRTALVNKRFPKDVYVVAVGKAAWKMAQTCQQIMGERIRRGIILTKYGYAQEGLKGFEVVEAGHPIPDENSLAGTQKILEMVKGLRQEDDIIFLHFCHYSLYHCRRVCCCPISGVNVPEHFYHFRLIVEVALSDVKGGRFAAHCAPARIYAIVLSDVVGDKLDMIASGPACKDTSTCEEALHIIDKYDLKLKEHVLSALRRETPRKIDNVETYITGSVTEFCKAAAKYADELGYSPYVLSSSLDCEAREAGKFMASVARAAAEGRDYSLKPPCAVIAGGETVVRILGKGTGGRNQEIALSAAQGIRSLKNVVLFSISSDGTDGPTDAAGGIVCGSTAEELERKGINWEEALLDNDSYHALEQIDGLIKIGATGTNVNDITVILCK